ncbi:MAG: GTP-binding protein [Chloroflexota bacterium]|nr:GTP-binding protein [Chloroflexota bacterium]MDQ5865756.1 GTP-binding protein [Chloroflexota bacterium]
MKTTRSASGLLYILVAAVAGVLLVVVPPMLASSYQQVASVSSLFGYIYLAILGAIFIAIGLTIFRLWRNNQRKLQGLARNHLSAPQKEDEIKKGLSRTEDILKDAPSDMKVAIDPSLADLKDKIDSQTLEIVAFGTISSGKSAVLNSLAGRRVFRSDVVGGTTVQRDEVPWPGADKVTLVDTPGLGEVKGGQRALVAVGAAEKADLIIFVLDGALKNSEFEAIKTLAMLQKRIIVALNKADWLSEPDLVRLTEQIREQLKGLVRSEDIVSVRALDTTRPRTRVMPDGTEIEETVPVPADITPLAERLLSIVEKDGRDLLLTNLLLQSNSLLANVRTQMKQTLDKRAHEIVSKYMWEAGAAAAIIPIPVLDLAAGAGLSLKMVVELARVYRQRVDLDTARMMVSEMGKNLVGTFGVTAVSSLAASAFKAVPGVGTIVGGLSQGLVQALITRWIGLVFIDYFREQSQLPDADLKSLAEERWKQITQPAEILQLAQEGLSRLATNKSNK